MKHAHNLGTLRNEAQELHLLTYYSENEMDDGDRETGDIFDKSQSGISDRDQRMEYLQQRLTLESLWIKTRSAAATDPSDKVFALLNISTTGELDIINYNKTLAGAYLDAAFSFQRPVELLDHVDLCAAGNKTNKLPNWLPNWHQTRDSMESLLDVGDARAGLAVGCGGPPAEATSYPGYIFRLDNLVTLRVKGLKVLMVAAVGPVLIPPVDEGDVPECGNHAEMINPFGGGTGVDLYYPTTERTYLECYKSVIEPCAEDYRRSGMPCMCTVWDHKESLKKKRIPRMTNKDPNLEASTSTDNRSLYTEEQLIRAQPIQYWQRGFCMAHRPTTNRQFFITEEGFVGLGSKGIEPGDLVCALFGGRLLHIVRPIELSTGFFDFMGNCYVYGLMDGEVFDRYPEDQVQDFFLA